MACPSRPGTARSLHGRGWERISTTGSRTMAQATEKITTKEDRKGLACNVDAPSTPAQNELTLVG
jgi:hypothetical protein